MSQERQLRRIQCSKGRFSVNLPASVLEKLGIKKHSLVKVESQDNKVVLSGVVV